MDLSSLRYAAGSRKNRKRVGCGDASGKGGTAGRGHKGYLSRAGSKKRAWSEGGQMPIHRRLPKRGFHNIFKKEVQIVNLDSIERLQLSKVTIDTLVKRGVIKSGKKEVKILGDGELKRAVSVYANAFSRSAREKIEAAGGKAELV